MAPLPRWVGSTEYIEIAAVYSSILIFNIYPVSCFIPVTQLPPPLCASVRAPFGAPPSACFSISPSLSVPFCPSPPCWPPTFIHPSFVPTPLSTHSTHAPHLAGCLLLPPPPSPPLPPPLGGCPRLYEILGPAAAPRDPSKVRAVALYDEALTHYLGGRFREAAPGAAARWTHRGHKRPDKNRDPTIHTPFFSAVWPTGSQTAISDIWIWSAGGFVLSFCPFWAACSGPTQQSQLAPKRKLKTEFCCERVFRFPYHVLTPYKEAYLFALQARFPILFVGHHYFNYSHNNFAVIIFLIKKIFKHIFF